MTLLEERLDAAYAAMEGRPRRKIDLTVAGREAEVVDEVLGVLGGVEGLELYHRSGRLVHVTEDAGGPKIETVESSRVRDLVSRHVCFTKERKNFDVEVATPAWIGDIVLSRPSWPTIRPLRGISTSPFLRRDGSICAAAGYDDASGILVSMNGERPLSVSASPSAEDAQEAMAQLLEPFAEFPFAGDEHRAVVAALILSILARQAYDGPTPLFLADAPVPGAGKGLLMTAATIIATGRAPSAAPWSKSEEERRKTITAKLAEGDPVVLFDNLTSTLGGASLDALLTSTRWSDRVLGKSESVTLENLTVWCATSNNCDVGGDTSRRALVCRLQPDTDRPELRVFRREALREHVRRQRPRLLEAALTVLRAYWVEYGERIRNDLGEVMREQREAGLEPFGSFEGWSVLIRGAVTFAGLPDPATTREMLRERASTELGELARLVEQLAEYQRNSAAGRHWTTGDLRKALAKDADRHEPDYGELVDTLKGMSPSRRGDSIPSSRSLGWIMRRYSDRIVTLSDGSKASLKVDGNSKNTTLWIVSGGFVGFGGFLINPHTREKEEMRETGAVSNPPKPTNPPKGDLGWM